MTCDACNRQFNYCFYIDDEFWRKVVGEDWFKNSQGRICAHCTLEALGGLDWYIIHNQPMENVNREQRRADAAAGIRRERNVRLESNR